MCAERLPVLYLTAYNTVMACCSIRLNVLPFRSGIVTINITEPEKKFALNVDAIFNTGNVSFRHR